jgi:hypothetical protein
MLGGQDQTFHTTGFRRRHNLVRIEVRRIEYRRRLVTVTPFFVGESVDGEMKETVELEFVPA